MWSDPEESRSDFILAAAVAIFGPLVAMLVLQWVGGFLGALTALIVAVLPFVFYGLAPLLLARYRDEGPRAFGLDAGREGLSSGLVVAAPLIALGVTLGLLGPGGAAGALGRLGGFGGDLLQTLAGFVFVIAGFAGAVLLYTFLTAKAREGFGRTEVSQVEVLRTFGVGAAGIALVLGLIVSIGPRLSIVNAVLGPLVLAAVVLLADRLVEPGRTTSRATVLAPALVALIVRVHLFGDLLGTLRDGLLAAGLVVVVAVLVETRRHAWAAIPVVAAAVIWPTGFAPLQVGL
jgi:hypothetical protein